jgi:pyrroloquinoline quinone (PQQ) biosynthesis protein C
MKSVADRRRDLTSTLAPRIDRLMGGDFVSLLKEQKVKPDDVLTVFGQYRHYCSRFPKFLSILLARTDSDVARRPLIENLWEESGEGIAQNSHLHLLDRFLTALSVKLKSDSGLSLEVAPGAAVSKYVDAIERFLLSQPLAAGFGFIGPGTEEVTSKQYSIFFESLRSYELLADSDLIFFASHIQADVRHANLFWHALENICESDDDWRHVKSGAEASLDLELTFWKELVDEL